MFRYMTNKFVFISDAFKLINNVRGNGILLRTLGERVTELSLSSHGTWDFAFSTYMKTVGN